MAAAKMRGLLPFLTAAALPASGGRAASSGTLRLALPVAALLSSPAASAAFANSAPALVTLETAGAQMHAFLTAAREESLAQRVRSLQDAIRIVQGSLGALRLDAGRLAQRADGARGLRVRDGFFAFDLARLRKETWMKRLELDRWRWEADAIEKDAAPVRGLDGLLAEAEKAADRMQGVLLDLNSEATYLESSVALTDPLLLGRGARHDASRVRQETQQMVLVTGMLLSALHDAKEKAAIGSLKEASAR